MRASIAGRIAARGWPRIAMLGVLVVSGGAALVGSIVLHRCGLSAMWARYALSMAAAYATFLSLLGLLTARAARRLVDENASLRRDSQRRQFRRDAPERPDFFDYYESQIGACKNSQDEIEDGNEALAYLLLLLAATIILICVYFIWTAPALLAELVVEGGLAVGLCRPFARQRRATWLAVALEETGVPALMMIACVFLVGVILQCCVPDATTLADVWNHAAPIAGR